MLTEKLDSYLIVTVAIVESIPFGKLWYKYYFFQSWLCLHLFLYKFGRRPFYTCLRIVFLIALYNRNKVKLILKDWALIQRNLSGVQWRSAKSFGKRGTTFTRNLLLLQRCSWRHTHGTSHACQTSTLLWGTGHLLRLQMPCIFYCHGEMPCNVFMVGEWMCSVIEFVLNFLCSVKKLFFNTEFKDGSVSHDHSALWVSENDNNFVFIPISYSFADSVVRGCAVGWIRGLGSDELISFLPQLVQAVKHEAWDISPTAELLLERALTSPRLAHHLYWLLNQCLPLQVCYDKGIVIVGGSSFCMIC